MFCKAVSIAWVDIVIVVAKKEVVPVCSSVSDIVSSA